MMSNCSERKGVTRSEKKACAPMSENRVGVTGVAWCGTYTGI